MRILGVLCVELFFYTIYMHLPHANFNLYGGLHFADTAYADNQQDADHDQGARR